MVFQVVHWTARRRLIFLSSLFPGDSIPVFCSGIRDSSLSLRPWLGHCRTTTGHDVGINFVTRSPWSLLVRNDVGITVFLQTDTPSSSERRNSAGRSRCAPDSKAPGGRRLRIVNVDIPDS